MLRSLFSGKKAPKKFNFTPDAAEPGRRNEAPAPKKAAAAPARPAASAPEPRAANRSPADEAGKPALRINPKKAAQGGILAAFAWKKPENAAKKAGATLKSTPSAGEAAAGTRPGQRAAGKPPRKPIAITIGPATIIIALLAFLLVGGWGALATSALVFGDNLSARLIAQQSDMQFAYEQKLLVFRSQLDRIAQQARSDRTDVESRITDLMLRQATIEAKQQMLLQMAGTAASSEPGADKRSAAPAATQFAVLDKSVPAMERLDSVERAIEGNEAVQNRLADSLVVQSNLRLLALRTELAALGLDSNTFAPPQRPAGLGLPLPKSLTDGSSQFETGLAQARRGFGDLGRLQQVANSLPLFRPVTEEFPQTSPFGNRFHPIFAYTRLHAGLDFGVPVGTPVHATGSGVVQSAAVSSGYGNLLIIDHGNGITTRYAHLSAFLVQQGQPVPMGMMVARSGNTGASTGPHLHYETRVNGEPIDPQRFLAMGKKPGPAS